MNYIIFSFLLIALHIQTINSNEIFPAIPGSETGITPIHSTGYFIQFSQKNKNMKDMFSNTISVTSNYTFHINTTNMNKKCTPECYINCQVQFEDIIEEKYCIINVCKCDIVNEKSSSGHYKGKKKKNTFFGFFLQKDYDNNLNYNKNDILIEGWVYVLFVIFILYEYFVNKYFYTKKNKDIYQEMENMNLYQKLISEEPLE